MAVWLDGTRHDAPTIPLDPADRGLLLGDGVFDTALVLGGRVACRDAHLERLARACETLGFAPDMELAGRMIDAAAADAGTGSVRLTATRGAGPRGLAPPAATRPTLIVSNAAGPPAAAFAPLRLGWSAIRRNETSPTSRLKTLNYLDGVLAFQAAKREGFDEALFLNTAGRVASAATGNVFALRDGELATPPLADGVLPGIVRAELLDLARRAGLQAREASLVPGDLLAADAVFVTSSLRLLAPATAIGGEALAVRGGSTLRRLAALLREAIAAECGAEAGCTLGADAWTF
ncbi:aminotransferase class IV [Aureimonas leprariae]|uniref:Probable branched-chain-amino-acid aminotransferase n=1 Tax=Plantimonas leprariae TaxID=2615207 RepID=A0A7V7PT57_9HYPH|nr:aminotransferase class IV [Aureimonas leprariae]KAB0682835.1 class IV aminotransferase [Aureimonas leprariae]